MSKVICDVCGTAYPETAAQCPICGCAKNSADQTAAAAVGSAGDTSASSYTYVKGGRFSKRNVRRRNQGRTAPERRSSGGRRQQEEEEQQSNTGLIIVVVLLLLAIIAVVIYIGIRVFNPGGTEQPKNTNTSQSTQDTGKDPSPSGTLPSGVNVPCEAIQLGNKNIEFTAAGGTWKLEAVLTPENTTDQLIYVSSNESVATVTPDGTITAVSAGEATITVSCGGVSQSCQIKCNFGSSENPTTPTQPVENNFVFEFNTKYKDETTGKADTTLPNKGYKWRAYKSNLSVDPEAITWISDDPDVCTIDKGIVTAVGPGKTEIHAEYGGKTYTCTVRCAFEADDDEDEAAATAHFVGDTETSSSGGTYRISTTDPVLSVGDELSLTLLDNDNNVIEVTWTAEESGIVAIDGSKITGLAAGSTKVSATYEDTVYSVFIQVID